jgi:hypothetical protein
MPAGSRQGMSDREDRLSDSKFREARLGDSADLTVGPSFAGAARAVEEEDAASAAKRSEELVGSFINTEKEKHDGNDGIRMG